MTDTNAPAVINASELTLLVADHPDARAYQANPINLSDPVEARETLAALRAEGEIVVVVGIEFDDPDEPGNRVVLTGDDLLAAEFVDDEDGLIALNNVLHHLDDLAQVLVTEAA